MEQQLLSICPIDGRYAKSVDELREFYSEYALMKYRVFVELEWFKSLFEQQIITQNQKDISQIMDQHNIFQKIFESFSIEDAKEIKKIEQTTYHDVKAVEYFLKNKFQQQNQPILQKYIEFLHFSCTSEDINNLAYALMIQKSCQQVIFPSIEQLINQLISLSESLSSVSMLSRTHGQSATPSTMGKEIANFAYRIKQQYIELQNVKLQGKFNGAVGNMNAHLVAFQDKDWLQIQQNFISKLEIKYNPYTTQIEPHDSLARLCLQLQLLDTILIDFCRDMWSYISLNYFKQKNIKGEIGSSTMPHKINPIDFENGEGNLGLSISLLQHFAQKLPISRFQRDLSDSTVLRNVGLAFSYTLQAIKSINKGLNRLDINQEEIQKELNKHYELLAEPVQTVMRKYSLEEPYEKLKEFTRGKEVSQDDFIKFIDGLEGLPQEEKNNLKELTPQKYIGLAEFLAKNIKKF